MGVAGYPNYPSKGHTGHPREPIHGLSEQNHRLRGGADKLYTSVQSTEGASPIFLPISASETIGISPQSVLALLR